MRFLQSLKCTMAMIALAGCCTGANAGLILIDSQVNGASTASGGPLNPDVLPGAFLPDIYSPKDQLTLPAGTYLITNAATTGYYSGWNFEGYPGTPNWVWSFLIADDATSKVLVDGFVSGVEPTQTGIADLVGTTTGDGNRQLSATSTAGFTDTFALTHTTTLDFLIDDYFLGDNGGGVALDVSPVDSTAPEPASITLCAVAGAIGICRATSRRRGPVGRCT